MTALFLREKLIADPMLQFPDAESSEQQALRPGESSNRWQFFLSGLSPVDLTGSPAFRLGFAVANPARGFTDGEVASVVHGGVKKQLASHRFPLVRGSVLLQLARSCLRIENWDA
jgi:hypothetical protein